jgi:hypothetical protein
MKRFLLAILALSMFGVVRPADTTANRELLQEYQKTRKVVIADLKKTMDPEFMELNSQFNRARRFMRDTILVKHPELAKIQDKAQRNVAITPFIKQMRENNDEAFLKYRDARINLEHYLMTVNPELRELYQKIDPKFRDKWLNEEVH